VPALRAGLRLVAEPWLLLLAADLPFLQAEHLRELRQVADGSGAAVLADDTGAPQWLASCWRTADVRAALDRYGGDSLRGVLGPLRPTPTAIAAGSGPPPWLDCDTADDVAIARKWVSERGPDEQHAG
jgi:molybdopterin-guanine dinucleotide biosynthesis protein A